MYDFNTLMLTGRYKLRKLGNIPANYFLSLWQTRKQMKDMEMKEFITANLELIKTRKCAMLNPIDAQTFRCAKITYPTKKDAQTHLSKIRDINKTGKIPIRSYECGFCSGWHLTSEPMEEFKNK